MGSVYSLYDLEIERLKGFSTSSYLSPGLIAFANWQISFRAAILYSPAKIMIFLLFKKNRQTSNEANNKKTMISLLEFLTIVIAAPANKISTHSLNHPAKNGQLKKNMQYVLAPAFHPIEWPQRHCVRQQGLAGFDASPAGGWRVSKSAQQTGKPPETPVDTAQRAIKTGKICG